MIGLIYFIVALGVIVLVHELGHLVVAKRNGVYCHEFSIGMGPRLIKLGVDKTGTEYSIRAIPIGGYVMLAGEDDDKSQDINISEDQMLSNKSAWIKIKVLAAGSFMNVLLAIFLMMLVGFFGGVTNPDTNQVTIQPESSLATAGVETGDTITEVNGVTVSNFTEISGNLGSEASNITYIDDENNVNTVEVTPSESGKYGVSPASEKYNFIDSIIYGFTGTWGLILSIFMTIKLLFTPEYGASDLAGFIGIYSMGNEVIQYGFTEAIMWIAYLSVNIGILNIMPIPALDGGRLVFAFYELIARKRANKKVENFVNYLGVFLMLGLFIFVTYNDIVRIFTN